MTHTPATTGCGSGGCQCAANAQSTALSTPVPTINGIALHGPDASIDEATLREMAWSELLRQQAVHTGKLARQNVLVAPELTEAQRTTIEQMLDEQVPTREPSDEECRRYHEAHAAELTVGQAMHVRHILFAVTPGVNVHALAIRAEAALLELSRKDVLPQRFEQLAAELSNCPSSAQGGDLGWITPQECSPELANELFKQTDVRYGMGVHPRLVHTRFGFHIIEVLGWRKGKTPAFEEAKVTIAQRLSQQARATALRHHMMTLVAAADIQGMALEGADSPLLQ
jgi:peptidyl-prolyl cis-trans isomerase C